MISQRGSGEGQALKEGEIPREDDRESKDYLSRYGPTVPEGPKGRKGREVTSEPDKARASILRRDSNSTRETLRAATRRASSPILNLRKGKPSAPFLHPCSGG
jgi:hypothetical protein